MKKITKNSKGDLRGMHMLGRHLSKKTREKISKNNARHMLGKHHSKETKEKNRIAHLGKNIGELHWNWKGTDAKLISKHTWIAERYGSPKYCEHCKSIKKKKYEWANVDHEYSRKKEDYIRLCTSCHRKYDYKFNNYKQ